MSKFEVKIGLCRLDINTQPIITGIVTEHFDMCQVGEYSFEIIIHGVNMVENEGRPTQSANVKVLRFSKNLGWSQFAYLKLRKLEVLDFEIAKVACIL